MIECFCFLFVFAPEGDNAFDERSEVGAFAFALAEDGLRFVVVERLVRRLVGEGRNGRHDVVENAVEMSGGRLRVDFVVSVYKIVEARDQIDNFCVVHLLAIDELV